MRMQRPLARPDHPLRADGAVELVLDLQQRGRELVVLAARVVDADGLVRWIRPGERSLQRGAVAVQAVVADRQRRLRIALVAQAPHAQRGGVRQVQRVRGQLLQLVLAPVDEAGTDRRRRAEQHQQQERLAPEIADQRKVVVVRQPRHRPVVVDARDGLHAPAVAIAQAHAVHALRAADVRAAVVADRNRLVGRQSAGHAGHPQHLAAGVAQHAVDVLVDLRQFRQARLGIRVHAGDQLELRLAVVGGDVRMRQRRAQRRRVRRECQRAAGLHAQALLLDAAAHGLKARGFDSGQSVGDTAQATSPITPPAMPGACQRLCLPDDLAGHRDGPTSYRGLCGSARGGPMGVISTRDRAGSGPHDSPSGPGAGPPAGTVAGRGFTRPSSHPAASSTCPRR